MTTLLQELSKKLAERWATVLIGPGLLFTACAVIAHHLGSQHALDVTELRQYATELARGRTTGDLLVIGAATTLGAVTAGLAVAGTRPFLSDHRIVGLGVSLTDAQWARIEPLLPDR
ncbi:hypothetical protein AB0L48_38815, partial [Streptomyces flaveolus]